VVKVSERHREVDVRQVLVAEVGPRAGESSSAERQSLEVAAYAQGAPRPSGDEVQHGAGGIEGHDWFTQIGRVAAGPAAEVGARATGWDQPGEGEGFVADARFAAGGVVGRHSFVDVDGGLVHVEVAQAPMA
jgi:hypothetical protein